MYTKTISDTIVTLEIVFYIYTQPNISVHYTGYKALFDPFWLHKYSPSAL